MEYCKHKDNFCYVCGHFVAKRNIKPRNENLVLWYRAAYDDAEWIDEDYVPSVICPSCYKYYYSKKIRTKYEFPMTWNNPGEHIRDTCYFCIHLKLGVNTRKPNFKYRTTPYIDLPVPYPEKRNDDAPAAPSDVNVGAGPSNVDAVAGPSNTEAGAAQSDMDIGDFDFGTGGYTLKFSWFLYRWAHIKIMLIYVWNQGSITIQWS